MYPINIKGASVEKSSLLIIYSMSYFVIKNFNETIEKNKQEKGNQSVLD